MAHSVSDNGFQERVTDLNETMAKSEELISDFNELIVKGLKIGLEL